MRTPDWLYGWALYHFEMSMRFGLPYLLRVLLRYFLYGVCVLIVALLVVDLLR